MAAILLAAGGQSDFGSDRTDKRQYTLFNPTPPDLMRELSTDRPDLMESPYTVDAGHFQIEMDMVNYSYDHHNPERASVTVETISLAALNLKLGLCNRVDLQLLFEPYIRMRIHNIATGLAEEHNGLGNNTVEGGIIFPFAAELLAGWGIGAMTEVDLLEDDDSHGQHAESINTITFGHDIVGNLAGYVKFFSAVSAETGSPWVGSVNFGCTYGFTDDIQLDTGLNIGVTRSADDLNPFQEISWRF